MADIVERLREKATLYGPVLGNVVLRDAIAEIERLREWHKVALMLGETLASVGPDAYYQMQPREWLAWAMKVTGATDQQEPAP